MAHKSKFITTYKPQHILQPIFTGGDIALDESGAILGSCLGEEAVITDLKSGQVLARVEGVSLPFHAMLSCSTLARMVKL